MTNVWPHILVRSRLESRKNSKVRHRNVGFFQGGVWMNHGDPQKSDYFPTCLLHFLIVLFDTGSCEFWVPGPNCKEHTDPERCAKHNFFQPSKSKTWKVIIAIIYFQTPNPNAIFLLCMLLFGVIEVWWRPEAINCGLFQQHNPHELIRAVESFRCLQRLSTFAVNF